MPILYEWLHFDHPCFSNRYYAIEAALQDWADLKEDKMINPAPGFWPIFGALGPTAGPGRPGNGPGLKKSAGCANNQPRRPILSPIRGHFVFLGQTAKR